MDHVTQESEEIAENGASPELQVKTKFKPRPAKVLPTSRIAFEKQLDILRAYPALSGPDHKPVKNKEVADLVDMSENTVSLANPFFTDVGFLQRQDGGLIPGEEVFLFLQAHKWEPESSAYRLAPCLETSWFGQALIPRLSFGPMDESRALAVLGETATASPEYTPQLRLLISYLEAAGLIERENGQLKLVKQQHVSSVPVVSGHAQQQRHSEPEQPRTEPPSVQQVVIQQSENLIQFHIR